MNNQELLFIDFDKICRLCLKKSESLLPVLSSTTSQSKVTVSVESTIRSCLHIEVNSDDMLPKSICFNCNQIVESWACFKQSCRQSNSILKAIVLEEIKKGDVQLDSVNEQKENGISVTQVFKKKKVKPVKKNTSNTDNLPISSTKRSSKENKRTLDSLSEQTDSEPFNECEICKQKFFHCHTLFDHLRKQHKVEKPYQCQECGKKYSTATLLSTHEGTHTKPFECDICLRRFANKQSLKAHKLYHEGGEKCDYCGKTCTSRVALSIHQRKHTGERPYTCHVCGKMFPYTKNLDLHMRTHNDDFHKDVCDVCGYATSIRSNFLKHVRRHTNGKRHVCGSCGKSFVEKCGLNKHLRRHCKGVLRKKAEKFDPTAVNEYFVPF